MAKILNNTEETKHSALFDFTKQHCAKIIHQSLHYKNRKAPISQETETFLLFYIFLLSSLWTAQHFDIENHAIVISLQKCFCFTKHPRSCHNPTGTTFPSRSLSAGRTSSGSSRTSDIGNPRRTGRCKPRGTQCRTPRPSQ